jgi:hypothetical protein
VTAHTAIQALQQRVEELGRMVQGGGGSRSGGVGGAKGSPSGSSGVGSGVGSAVSFLGGIPVSGSPKNGQKLTYNSKTGQLEWQ